MHVIIHFFPFKTKKGFEFESETDTETIAKLAKHIYDTHKGNIGFRELVECVIPQLVGADQSDSAS